MKKCSKCKRELPSESFGGNKKSRDGKDWHCKMCKAAAARASKQRRGGHEVVNRMFRYGLTQAEVEAYLQIPACQICNKPFASDSDVHFDHCHRNGHLRGVLCKACNSCLQKDSAKCIVRCERSIDYLLRDMEVRREQARAG